MFGALFAAQVGCNGGNEGDVSQADTDTRMTTAERDTTAAKKEYVAFADYVNPEDSLPRLRFRDDGLVSINDRCAVRKVKLNPKMPAAYVNGRPVGFC